MDKNNPLIDLGGLAEPVKVLVEKVSDAVGGVFRPYQIRRVARAQAEANEVKALSEIKITELQRRAFGRLLNEEGAKQKNIEDITRKALPDVISTAKPENVERDWLIDFFDKARLVSDEQMQQLWARVLAGEANSPGSFSKRTVHLLASLDKSDANQFAILCNFRWTIVGREVPLVYDFNDAIYKKNSIDFPTVNHLADVGLISRETFNYQLQGIGKTGLVSYQESPMIVEFPQDKDNQLSLGHLLFTHSGEQLAKMCTVREIPTLVEYVVNRWTEIGVRTYSPFPR